MTASPTAGARPVSTPRYRFYPARVRRVARIGASLIRVTLGGAELAGFAGGGRDQSVSLFLPHPGQPAPVLPPDPGEDWYDHWRAIDPARRAIMRSYTISAQRPARAEVDIDVVRHGGAGPGTRWAAGAGPGDPVVVLGPAVPDERSVRFRPPPDTGYVLLAGDETALPAVAGILAWLPAGTRVVAWVEVPSAADVRRLPSRAAVRAHWLVRGSTPPGAGPLADAIRSARLPAGTPYAWVAGESATVRAVRRHLVTACGIDRRRVTFVGYWRRGASEEELRADPAAG